MEVADKSWEPNPAKQCGHSASGGREQELSHGAAMAYLYRNGEAEVKRKR